MPYLLALCSSFLAATGSALQHREVVSVDEQRSKGLRLILASIVRPGWLLGMAVFLGAFGFQFAALRVGNLAQVQPVLTTELLFLLLIVARTHHERPGGREWLGASSIVVGLAAFLIVAHPHGGTATMSAHAAEVLSAVVIVAVAVLWTLSSLRAGWTRSSLLGAAAGVCFAYQASMTKIVAGKSPGAVFTSPAILGLAIGGGLGFFLFQHSMRNGHVAVTRSTMAIVQPLLAVIIGVVAFGDVLRHSPGAIALEAVGLGVLLFGAWRLATSELITRYDPHGPDEPELDQATTP